MTNRLDKTKVVNGNLIPVANVDRAPKELKAYILLYVEDINGENETPVLLTHKELDKLSVAELPFKQVKGRLYPLRIRGRICMSVLTQDWDKTERTYLITDRALQGWKRRAARNPEDIPAKKWWDDLMD